MTAHTGDVIATETEIAALPHGSVILDSHGDAAQKVAGQWHYPETNPVPDKRVAKYAPLTVLHVPGEHRALPSRENIIRTLAWADEHYWDTRRTGGSGAEAYQVMADAVLALLEGEKR